MTTFEHIWDEVLENDQDEDELIVEADKRKKAEKGILKSSTLTSCIALGAYDGQNGYMIHVDPEYEDPIEYLNELKQFTFHVSNEADLDEVQVMAGGGHLPQLSKTDYGDTGDLKQKENMYGKIRMIEDFLETYFESFEAEWGAEPGHYASLAINVNQGSFEYDKRADKIV